MTATDGSPLEKLQALYEEWGRGDFSRGDIFDRELKSEGFGMGEEIHAESLDEFVAAMRKWLGVWEQPLTVDAEEFVKSGSRILVLIRWSGRGKGSGVEIEGSGAHVWTFRDGLAVRFDVYRDRDEARAALEQPPPDD